jgi:hypothetical protein
MIATIRTRLDAPASKVWGLAQKPVTLLFISRGLLAFKGASAWPETFREGFSIETRLFFFHILPAWKHRLRIASIDDNHLELLSNECGGLIRSWNHLIRIEPIAQQGCDYTDRLEIKAGWITLLVWVYAHLFCRYRQLRWKRLLRDRCDSQRT